MKKVMVFGTYDNVHKGHEFFLKKAKEKGDYLIVVIGRDNRVNDIKGKRPVYQENKRLNMVKSLDYVDEVLLGNEDDPFLVIREKKPDIICLGYDQRNYTENLNEMFPKIIVKRIDSHHPDKYKSSIINKKK